MTGFIAALVEAWGEFKVQKMRVLLSLIGVAISVAALASVIGVGDLVRTSMEQKQEVYGGRTATISAYLSSGAGTPTPGAREAFRELATRYGLQYASSKEEGAGQFQFPDGVRRTMMTRVDPAYGVIHRTKLVKGSWFAADDAQRLTPALVVNEAFYNAMGRPDLNTQPEIKLLGTTEKTTVLIGVVPDEFQPAQPQAFVVSDVALEPSPYGGSLNFEVWVQPDQADTVMQALQSDLSAVFPKASVDARRADFGARGDPFAPIQWGISGIAGLVMFLGILSLLNITLVTIRYRVREIGIRRSFGATGSRVFFGVLMESIVATTIAGIVGVMGAIILVKNPWLESAIGQGMTEFPPFPISAALIGLGAAILAGAIAGAVPALIAVRVKVIDAIRF